MEKRKTIASVHAGVSRICSASIHRKTMLVYGGLKTVNYHNLVGTRVGKVSPSQSSSFPSPPRHLSRIPPPIDTANLRLIGKPRHLRPRGPSSTIRPFGRGVKPLDIAATSKFIAGATALTSAASPSASVVGARRWAHRLLARRVQVVARVAAVAGSWWAWRWLARASTGLRAWSSWTHVTRIVVWS